MVEKFTDLQTAQNKINTLLENSSVINASLEKQDSQVNVEANVTPPALFDQLPHLPEQTSEESPQEEHDQVMAIVMNS